MKQRKILYERISYLQRILEQKKEEIKHLPEGKIRSSGRNGKYHYYLRKNEKDNVGVYIRDADLAQAAKMLQREYDEKLIRQAQKELSCLKRLKNICQKSTVEEVYEQLPKGKQRLITPIIETEDQFITRCKNEPFVKKGFAENAPEYYSENHERMRSKSEILIANMLKANNIPYIYEKPFNLKGVGMVYPDFTILDAKNRRVILLEHLGMMDDPEYVNRQIRKIRDYQYNGLFIGENLLLSFESNKRPINLRQVEELVKHALSQ